MKIETKVVHSGDRKKAGDYIPVTTPIYTAASYSYDSMDRLDRVFGREEKGPSYARYDNPTTNALEDLVRDLEGGYGALACASGMSAVHLSLLAALLDRPKRVVAANALYGATTGMLMNIFAPLGIETTFADVCDLEGFEQAVKETKPGAILMETISNPLLRVGAMDQIAAIAQRANAPLIVDNTFATLPRCCCTASPELGAEISWFIARPNTLPDMATCSAVSSWPTEANFNMIGTLSRTLGPVMSPFESYLTMRGIKTLGLRVEKQCANACKVASWLATHVRVERVYFTGDPAHPDAATIVRLFPKNLYGAMVAFELIDAGRTEVFDFMDRLRLVVRATSLGDVHTMMLYPAMSSHRDLAPKQRHRLGIADNLIRMSIGIEASEDIIADLEQAL